MSTIATALLAAVWYWLGGSFIGYTIYPIVISPTVIGMVFGFLYGDVTTGLIAGASLEVIYIGMVNAGGNLPADRMLAGLIAIPVVLRTGVDPQVAVSIAIPVGIIGVFLNNIRRTGNAFLIQKADKFGFFLRFPVVFVASYFGSDLVQQVLNVIPAWIMTGLTVMGGVLPALGFAMTIFVIGKNKYIPLFIIAFYMVKFFELSVVGAAIFGVCIALLATFATKTEE